MTKEDRNLLVQDLCSRLPYGVKCIVTKSRTEEGQKGDVGKIVCVCLEGVDCIGDEPFFSEFGNFKPYLFPISSMTEEQKKEYYSLADDVTIKPGQGCYLGIKIHCIKLGISDNPHEEVWDYINLDALDWLNKNHFDYRGLIPKGLAIDCTNLNIY